MSFDKIMDQFANEFEMHPITSWVEEVDTDDVMDLEDIHSDASKKRKSSD